MLQNIYQPYLMNVVLVRDETTDVRTLRLQFRNEADRKSFFANYRAGQFGEYSYFGDGECTFCVATPPTRQDYIECTFRKAGRVTRSLYAVEVGETVEFRGPYGNSFPVEEWYDKNLLFVAGGIALPPLRTVILNCFDLRDHFKNITILYGARTVGDLVYREELKEWGGIKNVNLILTVDPGGETPDWKGRVGFVPSVLDDLKVSSDNAVAIVCGPPIMIKYTMPVLTQAGFSEESIFTTLENRMKCGLGKCGRCNVGPVYICKDGPVFSLKQLKALPLEY